MAQTDTLVERRRAEPHLSPVLEMIPAPEPNVIPLARVVPNRLLEGKVLPATEELKVAHWSVVVGPAEHPVRRDADTTAERDRVGRVPSIRRHGMDNLGFGTH